MKNTAELIRDISFLIRLYGASEESKANGGGKKAKKKEKLSELEILILEIMDYKNTKMYITDFNKLYPTITTSNFSLNISNLWRSGLVEKKNDPEDQRRTVVELTEKGREAVVAIRKRQMELYEEIANSLSLDPKKDKPVYHAAVERGINYFERRLKQKQEQEKEQKTAD